MRLLHTKNLKLEEFGDQNIPLYAILSHTWGKEEISLQDIETGNLESRQGFSKLKSSCCRAATDGFDYIWIDTCCIDKRSSAELSEAINSMYRWYQKAVVCYAYLEDVYSDRGKNPKAVDNEFRRSRWLTRGWTLQELIAPSVLIFFNQTWQKLGTKTSMAASISSFTHIPQSILLGGDLDQESVARRMSWASTRQTTRVEDLAYCLLGIFNINMPLLYGEGERAFVRVQEEIIKVSTDYSLFAWKSDSETAHGLLAPDPSAFHGSAVIVPMAASTIPGDAAIVDSEGVHVTLRVKLDNKGSDTYLAMFPCINGGFGVGIRIRGQVGGFFEREDCWDLETGNLAHRAPPGYVVKRICVQQPRVRRHEDPLQEAAKNGNKAVVNFLLENGVDPICRDIRIGKTPSSSAAGNGHEAVVRTFWDYELDELRKYQIDQMALPLSLAVENGHHEIVKVLLDRLDHSHGHNSYYFPELQGSLMLALRKGHCGVLKVLAEHGGHMARKALCQPEALINAIQSDSGDVVKLLLTCASKFTRTTGQTPMLELQLAHPSHRGPSIVDPFPGEPRSHHDVIQVLLKYYPDLPQQRTFDGYRPLDWAVRNNHEDVVKLLFRHCAGVEKAELSPFSIRDAAATGHESMLRLLLAESDHFKELIVEINVLRVAIGHRQGGVVKLLLEEEADLLVEYVDSVGETPLLRAARLGHGDIVDLLLADDAARRMDEQAKEAPTSL
ncbi:hypothetical protein LTS15_005111 [Exophiala xenobiotica]|nr:hypothetical protein LTS15_005111 [Exophiala xenobiotica]